ncbi:hypothetical protein [Cellulomonas aerilata]|uniref:O-antigen polymerase n=1 Tax=Cellulomonas aerilata TaxID=515326 RepID=A0A512DF16_9CELL|nr:hypothetical protein [Cellulomonas aerilata]GEO35067.1 hypothetical protein CAE01nite_27920 [Cellulomonas aerilata]
MTSVRPDQLERTLTEQDTGDGDGGPGPLIATLVAAAVAAVVVGLTSVVHPLAPLGAVLAIVLIGLIWRRPLVASVVVASVVPAMAGLGRDFPVPGFKLSELLLVVCLVPLLVRRLGRWRRINAVDVSLAAVAVFGLVVGVVNGIRGDLELAVLLRDALFPAFTFATWWVVSRGISSRAETNVVLRWVLLVSMVPALLGLLQFVDAPGVRDMLLTSVGSGLQPEPGELTPRITGPFTIAHSLGGYLVVPLLIAAVLLLRDNTEVLRRRGLVAVLAIDTAALVLSVTITTLLWVIVGFLVAAVVVGRFQRGFIALVLGAALCTALFWPSLVARYEQQTTPTSATGMSDGVVPQTLAFRIQVWQNDYIPLLAEAAPLGLSVGPNDVAFKFTESQYITLILRGGVGLLLVTAISLIVLARRSWRAARMEDGSVRAASAAVFGVLVFLPVACLIWPYVTNAGTPQSLFAAAGAVVGLAGSRPEPAVARQLAIRRRLGASA